MSRDEVIAENEKFIEEMTDALLILQRGIADLADKITGGFENKAPIPERATPILHGQVQNQKAQAKDKG